MVKRTACLLLLFVLAISAVFCQTPPLPPSKPRPLGPGDPLPTFSWIFDKGTIVYEYSISGAFKIVESGGAVVTMGDLRIQADKITVLWPLEHLEATGHVVLTRGDESLHGSSFVLDGDNATFTAENSTLASPPLFVTSDRLSRTADSIIAENAQISTGTDNGAGELQIHAATAHISPENVLKMQNASVSLYGVRLFTLRRLTIRLGSGTNGKSDARSSNYTIPVDLRDSQISGFVFGLNHPFKLYKNLTSRVDVDETTQQGIEYAMSLRYVLYSRGGPHSRSALQLRQSAPLASNPSTIGESRLRQLLTARQLAPAPDPLLDYTSILPTVDLLAQPTRNDGIDLHLDVNVSHNREVGSLRQGPVLVSRQPEFILAGLLPIITEPIPDDEHAAREALRRPRLALTGEFDDGSYEETRLNGGRTHISDDRTGAIGGLTTLPILVGSRVLLLAESTIRDYHYQSGGDYHYLETSINTDYVFSTRTAVGVSYITRALGGSTPFYFDQVDTQDEGQIHSQFRFGPNAKYTFAALGRYDIGQRRFFDSQFALGIRGHNIEPRFSYTHLNRQFSLSVALPGLTSP